MSAPLSPSEAQRLQTLREYHILDTPPEIAFDRLTSLAAQIFEVPIALVSFVDADRQWFKACFGLDRRQSARDVSFCAYTILSDEVLVVEDALADPRFTGNALVTGPPYIRFYAGAPLRAPNGQNLGSLCVIDSQPRQFSAQQQEMLAKLAALVVDELELRRTARELREERAALAQSEETFRQFAENINVIFWMISPVERGAIYISPAIAEVSGRPYEEVAANPIVWMDFLHPDDRQPFSDFIINIRNGGDAREHEFRLIRPDGSTRWLKARAFPICNAEGKLYRIAGISEDITRTKQIEETLRQAKNTVEHANQLLEQRVRERTADLAQSQVEILTRLARAAEFRDDATGQHTQRVACTATLLARALGLSARQVRLIEKAAPLHDVGKIAISDLILLKPGPLTPAEYATMQTHAHIGAALLSDGRSRIVQMAERIAASHHEHWDGSGYPLGLAGEQIPLEGRILAIADVFDALTHERPYKEAWSVADSVAEIKRQSGKQFDPKAVAAFLTLPHEELV